jgi:hypothetical protein
MLKWGKKTGGAASCRRTGGCSCSVPERPDQARPITVKLLMNGPAMRGSFSMPL